MPAESVETVAEFQVLGDVTEKLRAPNAVRVNGTVSRMVLEELRKRARV